VAIGHGGEQLPRPVARLIRRQDAVFGEGVAPAYPIAVSILDQVGLDPRRLHAKPEPGQLVIPYNDVPFWVRLNCVNRAFEELRHDGRSDPGKQWVSSIRYAAIVIRS